MRKDQFVNVLRERKFTKIQKDELLVGDIVFIEEGDIVPADCIIINSVS